MTAYDVLLLDFGGVCLLNPVELHDRATAALGLPPGTFTWMGPLDPAGDPLWQRLIAADDGMTEHDYWSVRASEVGAAGGVTLDVQGYMKLLYERTEGLIRAECTAVVEAAQAAGLGVSVLTNDLGRFHGEQWQRSIPLLSQVDHVVDCSHTGVYKPDPAAYEHALAVIGADAGRTLFVDDQPVNVTGAEAVGMDALWFDIRSAAESWRAVAHRLGVS